MFVDSGRRGIWNDSKESEEGCFMFVSRSCLRKVSYVLRNGMINSRTY